MQTARVFRFLKVRRHYSEQNSAMNPKQGSETPYWLTYRENREFSMTESNTSYNGESNKLKCFRLRPSIETRWPAWNDLKLHKLKDENKRKHHPQTVPAQKQSDGKAKQCHSDQQCDKVGKSCVCGQMTCIFTSYQAARGCDEPSQCR